jgi:hypothetical protein
MEQTAAWDVAHEARRGRCDARSLDTVADISKDRGGIPALFSEFRIESLAERLRCWPQARCRLNLIQEDERVIKRLRPELPTAGAIGLQWGRRIAQAADLGPKVLEHQPAISRAASTA